MHKTLIAVGIIIVVTGLFWPYISKLPFGRLPGDIIIERQNFKFYFPVVSMILLSATVSLILWLFRK